MKLINPCSILIVLAGCSSNLNQTSNLTGAKNGIFSCSEDNGGTWLGCKLLSGPKHMLVDVPTDNVDQWAYDVTASYDCHIDRSMKGRETSIVIKIGDAESVTPLKVGEVTHVRLEGFQSLYLEDTNPVLTGVKPYFFADQPCDISVEVSTTPGMATVQKWELRANQLVEELKKARKLMFLKQRLEYYYDPGTSERDKSGILSVLEGMAIDDNDIKDVIDLVVAGYPINYIDEVLGDSRQEYSRLVGEADELIATMSKWNFAQKIAIQDALSKAKRPL